VTCLSALKMAVKFCVVGWCGSQCGGLEVISASDWNDDDTSHAIGDST